MAMHQTGRVIGALVATLMSLASVNGTVFLGSCPNQPVATSFDTTSFVGDWYEYSSYVGLGQVAFRCPKEKYSIIIPGRFNVEQERIILGVKNTVKGQMKFADPKNLEAKLSISFVEGAFDGRWTEVTPPNYNVLKADPAFIIVWDCTNLVAIHFPTLRILTRQPNPPQFVIDEIYKELEDRGISTGLLLKNSLDDCS
ncbi:apolipoprotein D [Hyalella azteca]|uniref:Apolipoprotein D n=1 Tax=Hyalella azteca TaxID=294128 RepID=A0A8B7P801_HYAAZ|nr:apolipoprotein D [Hyalella azteca]